MYISTNTSFTCLLLSQEIRIIWNLSRWVSLFFKHCPAQLMLLYLCTCDNPKGMTATRSPSTLHPCKAELKLYSIILLIAFRWQATLVPLISPRAPQQAALNTSRFSFLVQAMWKNAGPGKAGTGTGNTLIHSPTLHTSTPEPNCCPYFKGPTGRTACHFNCVERRKYCTKFEKEWQKKKEIWKQIKSEWKCWRVRDLKQLLKAIWDRSDQLKATIDPHVRTVPAHLAHLSVQLHCHWRPHPTRQLQQ